jgi:glycosyltransferase involved in cell wall biosynthesis
VVERQSFRNDKVFLRNVQALASKEAVIINLSSPWAFSEAFKLRILAKHHFAFAFNNIGTDRIINCRDPLTEVWPVYDALRHELRKLKNSSTSIEVIYVGIQQTNKSRKTQASRRKLNVGWIGRLSPEKDPQKFIATSKLLNSEEFTFSMAGDGPLQKKVLLDLKHHANFKYLGFVASSKKYLEKLDILVLTSKIEGIPLVAMEALQNGVYVIAPRIGGIPDLINDKQNGLLYNGTKKDLLMKLIEARSIILSGDSKPKLNKKFLEETMFNHIDSRIKHYHQLS